MPPLERHPLLRPLSREHHHALWLCGRIRRALMARTDPDPLLDECRLFFRGELLPHFGVEEEVVFPVLDRDHPLVRQAISEHRRLSRLFLRKGDATRILRSIETELEAHIRFEERVLFPLVQEMATAEQLERIDRVHGLVDTARAGR